MAQPLRVDDFVEELKKYDRKEDFLIMMRQYEQRFYDAYEHQANANFPPELQRQHKLVEQQQQYQPGYNQQWNKPKQEPYDYRTMNANPNANFKPPLDRSRSHSANKLQIDQYYQQDIPQQQFQPQQIPIQPQIPQIPQQPFSIFQQKPTNDPFRKPDVDPFRKPAETQRPMFPQSPMYQQQQYAQPQSYGPPQIFPAYGGGYEYQPNKPAFVPNDPFMSDNKGQRNKQMNY